jgi:hypothetical protein
MQVNPQFRASMIQRSATKSNPVNAVPPIVHEVLNSAGQPLETGAREFMESRFGHDFSGVQVHTDSRAAESARAVNALAYTVGQSIVFDYGLYSPRTQEGANLLSHELIHVQQNKNFRNKKPLASVKISDPNSNLEVQARDFKDSFGQIEPVIADSPFLSRQSRRGHINLSDPQTWGTRSTISVSGRSIDVFGATSAELGIIQNTLSIIPIFHLNLVPQIAVADRVGPLGSGAVRHGGNSVRSDNPLLSRIELTHDCLVHKLENINFANQRMQICFTLLHEVGHWVDWEPGRGIMRGLSPEERRSLEEWFQTLHYRGRTVGPGERAAEAYQHYFRNALPQRIRRILEGSRAFQIPEDAN